MKHDKLITTVGAGAAAILLAYVPQFEGVKTRPYLDAVKVLTVCAGHTGPDIQRNKTYTPAECDALLADDLVKHAQGVLRCTPQLATRTYQLAAATSFAFNVGVGAYCSSTMARLNNAGNYLAACAQLDRWVYAGGRKLNGLVKRRKVERELCETELTREAA